MKLIIKYSAKLQMTIVGLIKSIIKYNMKQLMITVGLILINY